MTSPSRTGTAGTAGTAPLPARDSISGLYSKATAGKQRSKSAAVKQLSQVVYFKVSFKYPNVK